jgi:hypothetical protein
MLDGWLSRDRVRTLARLFLLGQVCAFGFFVAGTHGAFAPQPKPQTTTDFASFYAAGTLADRGRAPAAYDRAVLRATGRQVIEAGIDFNPFLNPPIFLLICAPLAKLPYLAAFVLFEFLTAMVWLIVTTRIAGGGAVSAIALAAIPAVWWALGWGQNSFLSASLMGVGTLLLRRRPWLAGAAFGALCFKPHYGILIPFALLAGRCWRAILGAGLSVGLLAGLTTLCFGTATWAAFLDMAIHARQVVEGGTIAFKGHVDAAGAARLLGVSAGIGWTIQAAVSLSAAGAVAWVWWPSHAGGRPAASDEARHAALVAGTLAAMPFLLFYDLVMAGVAAAWLVRAARLRGWRSGEPTALAVLGVVDLVAYPSASLLRVAIGSIVAPWLLQLSVRRAGVDRATPESR